LFYAKKKKGGDLVMKTVVGGSVTMYFK